VAEIRPDQLSASTVVLAKDGKFFVYEPGLGVIASGSSIETAYEKFNDTRQTYLAEVEHAGLRAVRPAPRLLQTSVARELAMFCSKFCIVLIVLTSVAIPGGMAVSHALEQAVANVSKNFASTGSVSLKDVAQKAADIAKDARDLPPEKKELLRRSLGEISREIEPFVDAWRNPPDPNGAPAQPPSDPKK
jgi:hypothetical protein